MKEKETVCWRCRNAVPDEAHGCPWSRSFQPVPGWRARAAQVSAGEDEAGGCRMIDSFLVLSCPLFQPDAAQRPRRALKAKEYMRQYYARRAAKGLCVRCGKPWKDPRTRTCPVCRERVKADRRKRKEEKR